MTIHQLVQSEENNRVIELSIGINYVKEWGFWEAAREILQNAIDTKDFKIITSPYDKLMKIQSNGGLLSLSSLMLGETTKADDEMAIGKYGEGYKLAMLVLCRQGYDLRIANGNDVWKVAIGPHSQLGSDCLQIEVIKDYFEDEDREGRVEFVINGMKTIDFDTIEDNYFNPEDYEIVAEHEGSYCFDSFDGMDENDVKKVFVGGLFVCDLNLDDNYRYNYNFAPNVLELDRDRNAVDSFYLQYYATKLLVDSGNMSLLMDIANDGFADVSDYYQPPRQSYSGGSTGKMVGGKNGDMISKMSLESFLNKHGDNAFPIKTTLGSTEISALKSEAVKLGLVPIEVSTIVYDTLPIEIKDLVNVVKLEGKVSDALEKFIEENKKHMRSKAVKNLNSLIQSIKLKGE